MSIPTSGAPLRCCAGRVAEGTYVVTSSNATTVKVRELLATDRVRTIHLGPPPDPDRSRPMTGRPACPTSTAAPFILALGTIERRKNLPTLVAAFGRLAHEHRDVRLVIAGADGERPTQRRQGDPPSRPGRRRADHAASGPSTTSRRTGSSSTARTLAYPSLDEGFGFPILEAQQLGTPVVASTAGSIPEIAGAGRAAEHPTRRRGARGQPLLGGHERRHARQAGPSRPGQPPPIHVVAHRRPADRPVRRELLEHDDARRRSPSCPVESAPPGSSPGSSPPSTTRRRSRPSSTPPTTARSTGCRSRPTSTPSPTPSPVRSTRTGVGGSSTSRWTRDGVAGTVRSRPPGRLGAAQPLVQPRRSRPRHPPVPHRSTGRGGHASPTVTDEIRRAWDVPISIVPMTDDRIATTVDTVEHGEISFQDYFVRLHHDVAVTAVRFVGDARLSRSRATGTGARRRGRDRTVEPARVDRPDPITRPMSTSSSPHAATAWSPCRRSSAVRHSRAPPTT